MNKNTEEKFKCPKCGDHLQLCAIYYFTVKADIDPQKGIIAEPQIGNVYLWDNDNLSGIECRSCKVLEEKDESYALDMFKIFSDITDIVGMPDIVDIYPILGQFDVTKKGEVEKLKSKIERLKQQVDELSQLKTK